MSNVFNPTKVSVDLYEVPVVEVDGVSVSKDLNSNVILISDSNSTNEEELSDTADSAEIQDYNIEVLSNPVRRYNNVSKNTTKVVGNEGRLVILNDMDLKETDMYIFIEDVDFNIDENDLIDYGNGIDEDGDFTIKSLLTNGKLIKV